MIANLRTLGKFLDPQILPGERSGTFRDSVLAMETVQDFDLVRTPVNKALHSPLNKSQKEFLIQVFAFDGRHHMFFFVNFYVRCAKIHKLVTKTW